MNGKPEQTLIGIAISNRFSVEAIDELYKGIRAACTNYKVDLVGGDTTGFTFWIIISVRVLGRTEKGMKFTEAVLRTRILFASPEILVAPISVCRFSKEKKQFTWLTRNAA